MNLESWISKNKKLLAILLLALIIFFIFNQIWPMSVGYLTATQGLQAEFHSLYTNGKWLSNTEKPSSFTIQDRTLSASTASNWFFGYELNFDPDEPDDGFPNLVATQQPIAVDMEVGPKHYDPWTVDKGLVTLPNGTKAQKIIQFEMWRYQCEWSINIELSGSKAEACDRRWDYGIAWEPNYGGVDIWIRLEPRAFVYFEDNPDEVYFAPAYIAVTDYVVASIDENGKMTIDDPEIKKEIDLIPKAKGETLGIYYERGGLTPVDMEEKVLTYKGIELDPEIFRDEYWIHISLLNFKPRNTVDFWTKVHNCWFPSVQLDFKVYVLVVGKWTVYLTTEEVEELQPHEPVVIESNPWKWLSNWWNNPMTQIWMLLFMGFIALVLIAVFAPGVLTAITAWMFRKKD